MLVATVDVGDILAGKLQVEGVLGRGGMGLVLVARHTILNERVAVKLMRSEDPLQRTDPTQLERFYREARAAARLKGAHITRVMDVGVLDDGSPYIVMEHIDGVTLSQTLRQRGPLPIEEAADLMMQACEGLAEAHAAGIVHRDIKPSNLMITRGVDGSPLVKILDFGIARHGGENSTLTGSSVMLGSPSYMSPEQIRDAHEVDARSDLWSLGVTLHELLAGQTPFHAFTAPGVLSRVLTEEPTPLSSLCPALPDGLEAVVARCLEKDAERRFPSILDLADALAPFVPEPDEGARVRRIWAFTLRPAPEPEPSRPHDLVASQITDAPTSLTQAPELAPPVASMAIVPGLSAELPRRAPRRPWKLVAGLAFASLLVGGLSLPSFRTRVSHDPASPAPSSGLVAASVGPVVSVVPAGSGGPAMPPAVASAPVSPAVFSPPVLPAASPLPASGGPPVVSVVVLAAPGPPVGSSAPAAGKPPPPASKPLSPPASKPPPPPTSKPAPPPLLGEFGSRQ